MKKVILILLTNLLCIVSTEAHVIRDSTIVDTLPKRVINGLEVIPIKISSHKTGKVKFWRLQLPDLENKIKSFESKYPGIISYSSTTMETRDSIYDWQDNIWHNVVPVELKTLVKNCPYPANLVILLYINKEGSVFTVEFQMTDNVFQALNSIPQNTMKELYKNLLKETCETIKQIEFHYTDKPYGELGKEFIVESMNWYIYNEYGTYNRAKLLKILENINNNPQE